MFDFLEEGVGVFASGEVFIFLKPHGGAELVGERLSKLTSSGERLILERFALMVLQLVHFSWGYR